VVSALFFRLLFSSLWVLFLVVFTWVAHSIKWSAGRRNTRRAGRFRAVALTVAGFYFIAALLYALVPRWISFLSIPLVDPVRLLMVAVAFLGVSVVFWGLRALSKNWAPSLSGVRKDTSLVTSGPYRFVRHPIYLGAFVFLVAEAFLSANLLVLTPTIALCILLCAQLPEEENLLIDRFGDQYREYMKRTPRFIPDLNHER